MTQESQSGTSQDLLGEAGALYSDHKLIRIWTQGTAGRVCDCLKKTCPSTKPTQTESEQRNGVPGLQPHALAPGSNSA